MALTFEESAALMTNPAFRGRVKVACVRYADTILVDVAEVSGRTAQVRWASQTLAQPDVAAGQAQPATVMDPAVQADGADISDDALQAAVQATVNKML
jgi:hypothetical protein